MSARRERVEQEPGFLLHHSPYRESSRLLEVFTREHGRVGLVARGARRAGAQRAALQPFQALRLSWTLRGELGTLTAVEAEGPYRLLPGRALLSAWYMNELLLRLLARQDPHGDVFAAYAEALEGLAGGRRPAPVLRIFEKRLLAGLGYGLQLSVEAETGTALAAEDWYRYDLEHGPVRVATGRQGELVFRGRELLALEAEELSEPEAARAARRLLQAALRPHLGERELQSRRVLRGLVRQNGLSSTDGDGEH